ncbi:MAG: nucleotidyl transferase AbiEii/AbiGii toxin family protein [Myxococcota bacterium]
MTRKEPKNVAASVRARLLARAKTNKEDFQLVLTRFVNERILYRLSRSEHAPRFVLKGATLFVVWRGNPHRATRDLDLLGFGASDPESVRKVFTDMFRSDVEEDGVTFDLSTLSVGPIRDDQRYGGVRATILAGLSGAKVRAQIDVGFGDVVTPTAAIIDVPTILDLPSPRLHAYPRETVVAEKIEAMCQLGLANSRMKDFYDLVILSRDFEFAGGLLHQAIRATFDRRGTAIPTSEPVALTPVFYNDASKRQQWRAFQKKARGTDLGDLPAVMAEVRAFALPLIQQDELTDCRWVDSEWCRTGSS